MKRTKKNLSVFQGRLPFAPRSVARAAEVSFTFEKRAFVAAGMVIGIFAVCYSYLVMLSVSHVVAREALLDERTALLSEVAELERASLAASRAITEADATARGFVRTTAPLFIERGSFTYSNAGSF